MAKVKIKNRAAVQKGIAKSINGFINDADSMNRVAKIISSEMKDELTDRNTQNKEISRKWAQERNRLLENNKASKYFIQGRKSNIHFTGKLVSSLSVKNIGKGSFIAEYLGQRLSYIRKGADGENKKRKRIENKKIAKGLSEKGYTVFFLPRKKAPERILNIFKRYLRRIK